MSISWKTTAIFSSGIVVGLSALLFAGIIEKHGFPQQSDAQLLNIANKKDLPFICPNCNLTNSAGFQDRLKGKDLTNSFLYGAILQGDFSSTIFNSSTLSITNIDGCNFTNASFKNAKISGQWEDSNLSSANFTGASISLGNPGNNDFSNANFTNATLAGSNFAPEDQNVFTGAIWSNTTCPDGTNSNNDGNTCEGHLTP